MKEVWDDFISLISVELESAELASPIMLESLPINGTLTGSS